MLENVGDLWEELAVGSLSLLKPTRRIPKDFTKGIAVVKVKLEKLMEQTMTAFFTSNLEKADDALDMKDSLEKELKAFSQASGLKCDGKGAICSTCTFLRTVLRPIEQVAKYYGTIAQITINRSLEPPKGSLGVAPAAPAPAQASG
jgi:phosphate uptake regulator